MKLQSEGTSDPLDWQEAIPAAYYYALNWAYAYLIRVEQYTTVAGTPKSINFGGGSHVWAWKNVSACKPSSGIDSLSDTLKTLRIKYHYLVSKDNPSADPPTKMEMDLAYQAMQDIVAELPIP